MTDLVKWLTDLPQPHKEREIRVALRNLDLIRGYRSGVMEKTLRYVTMSNLELAS